MPSDEGSRRTNETLKNREESSVMGRISALPFAFPEGGHKVAMEPKMPCKVLQLLQPFRVVADGDAVLMGIRPAGANSPDSRVFQEGKGKRSTVHTIKLRRQKQQ